MISQTAEYALRAMVCLAQHPDKPITSGEVAELTRVPTGYLYKVLQALGRAGLVSSQRGLGGGFVLEREPGEISILDVVNTVDPIERIDRCPLKLKDHGTRLCPLHRKIDEALAATEKAFASTSLADLLEVKSGSKPLCETESSTGISVSAKKKGGGDRS